MGHVLEGILRLPPLLALALVFLLPALEASAFLGVIIPGEIGVILGGVLANQHKLPLAAVLAAGVLGAIIGDSVGYWVGSRWGERLLDAIPNRLLKPRHVRAAEESIRRFGG
jgi:undecaprenyl-diphosphatase